MQLQRGHEGHQPSPRARRGREDSVLEPVVCTAWPTLTPGFRPPAPSCLRCWGPPLTTVAVVVHQDDLLEEPRGRAVHHTVHGAQDDGEGLVDKDEDHRDLG